MCPELFDLGPISIKTYGFFVALGFLAGIYYISRQASRYFISIETILDLCLYVLVSGLLGARALYVALNWAFYRNNLVEILFIWSGGLVLYGGVITALLAGIFYVKKKNLEFYKMLDLFTPAFFLGLAIGRIGCLSAGCCYGKPTTSLLGIVFTNQGSFAPLNVRLHPVQVYESLFCFLLFAGAHYLNNREKKPDGAVFFVFLALYSGWRFFIEFFRGDDRGPVISGAISPSQFISIILMLISMGVLFYLWKKNSKPHSQTSA